jgi:hypothetical protein
MIGTADPMMIKMDVEGYEEDVLKGAEVVLTRGCLKCLILEAVTSAVQVCCAKRVSKEHITPFHS